MDDIIFTIKSYGFINKAFPREFKKKTFLDYHCSFNYYLQWKTNKHTYIEKEKRQQINPYSILEELLIRLFQLAMPQPQG